MGAKGSVEAAKLNADNWGHLEVCTLYNKSLFLPQKNLPPGWLLDVYPRNYRISCTKLLSTNRTFVLKFLFDFPPPPFLRPHSMTFFSSPTIEKNLFLSLDCFCLFFINFFVYTFEIWVIFDQVGLVRCFAVHSNICRCFEWLELWETPPAEESIESVAKHSRNFDFRRLLRFKCVSMFDADLQVGVP